MSICHIKPVSYGQIRYYQADRCWNTAKIRSFNQGKIVCNEIVSYDCGLFEMQEVYSPESAVADAQQFIAVIIRPDKNPVFTLAKCGFTFCGYDLVEESSSISAITNCGASFASVNYESLTEFGLIPTYKEAALTQLALVEEAPYESHADCEIVEIWRKVL